jgi:arabinogalactan oligomer / maltooligosaccharide transport system permease protein
MSTQVVRETAVLKKRRQKTQWSAYAFLSPALIGISVLSIGPMLYTIYISFTNFNQMHFLSYQFVGLKNFAELLNPNNPLDPVSDLFIPTLIWTIVYALCATGLSYIVGLFLAVLLNNRNMRESAFYRAILIIPWAVPTVITMLTWKGLLNDSYGQINALLHWLGLPTVPWLGDPFWAKVSIIIANVWTGFPYMMLVCLGALQAIPTELYESAAMDGADWWKQFRYVTLPEIWRLSLPLVIPSFAFNFNNFNATYLLTNGDPPRSTNPFLGTTDILASAAYKMTLNFNRYDLAAAISVLLFLLVAVISLIQIKFTKAFEEVDA